MWDDLSREAVEYGDDNEVRAILNAVCEQTGMGFAAVARVTEDRWIACQVVDKIEFGMKPGDELEIKKTICNEIRQSGEMVVIDRVAEHVDWRTHPVPVLYGFESYVSIPIVLADGQFFGTLCAIDPEPRRLTATATVGVLAGYARRLEEILAGQS
ncbi:GAF domain-containing protein [Sphingobium subterraneum]|uniref:GAF domain-containing protein n=1 Tax=Sphingobium subterraneum TaxID=627688 RepID=A0A841IY93_9SPHN|nr:GAF domain-containing protein [Sphingobium subterraneum]MBB6123633.1 GAF domain-containing protein [Sphingobium subterraneum]